MMAWLMMASWSPYGGAIEMPVMQRLADNGLTYSQWHTTALCSPTRSCLLTGRNHHVNRFASITEGSDGRVFEVTKDHELVWEFISPYWGQKLPMNMVYRAYRVPYEWVPQLGKQEETPIERIDVNAFRMPGAAALGDRDSEIAIEGCAPYEGDNALCVASVDDPEDQ